MVVMNLRGGLSGDGPGIDAVIAGIKKCFILVELFVAQVRQVQFGKPAKQKIGFLHARVAGLIDKAAQPRLTGFGAGIIHHTVPWRNPPLAPSSARCRRAL